MSEVGGTLESTPILRVSGLSMSFGGLVAVSDLSFEVSPGEIVAMIGPNGAGKTTVFNVLTALYRPTSGTMSFDGHDLGRLSPHEVTTVGLARTFQNIRLFRDMSALDNVKVGRYCRTRAGLWGALTRLPWTKREEREIEARALEVMGFLGILDLADELAKSLPYGDQKLLEIARALATEPRMLLLDEPAAGLNSSESAQLVKLVRQIRDEGVTIMLIEHDMKVVMNISERILVLDHGIQICSGTPEVVQHDQHVIEAYLGKAV
jgi:branched-chain amino acid transport system ATP-binding protein